MQVLAFDLSLTVGILGVSVRSVQMVTITGKYDGPNGSFFTSIRILNSEFRIPNSEFRIPHFEKKCCV